MCPVNTLFTRKWRRLNCSFTKWARHRPWSKYLRQIVASVLSTIIESCDKIIRMNFFSDDCHLTNSRSSTSKANAANGERRRIIAPTQRTNSRTTTTTTTTRDPSERVRVTPPPPPGEYGANDDDDVQVLLLKSPKTIVHSINDVRPDQVTRPVSRPSAPKASGDGDADPSSGPRRYFEDARSAPSGGEQSKVRAATGSGGSSPDPEAEVKEARVDVREHERNEYVRQVTNDAAAVISFRDRGFVTISALLLLMVVVVIMSSSSAIELSTVLR